MTLVWYFAQAKPIAHRIIYGSIFVLSLFYCKRSITMKYVASDVVLWALFCIWHLMLLLLLVLLKLAANIILNIRFHSSALNVYIVFHSDIEFNTSCFVEGSKHLHGSFFLSLWAYEMWLLLLFSLYSFSSTNI